MRNLHEVLLQLRHAAAVATWALLAGGAHAAAPGIAGPAFDLVAKDGYISQPDGASVYSWGYGCNTKPAAAAFVPATIANAQCPAGQMQLPGPTMVVNQGDTVTVTLHNGLPAAAGSTSILFPGFHVTTSGGSPGVLAQEAVPGGAVTYTFVADTAGTHSYYSGTQGDLQVEMGMFGALIVLPSHVTGTTLAPLAGAVPAGYAVRNAGDGLPNTCFAHASSAAAKLPNGDPDYRLAAAAFDHVEACYDREYLIQLSEMDIRIHNEAQAQKDLACTATTGCMVIDTEPYHPAYFMVNGRSMPDDMDPNYASQYPLQPYNGNPHMHPGELVLLRIIGQGRMQHPLHEHANHVRVLARDGNMLLSPKGNLAGPLLFTTSTTPGQTIDGIFQYTGKGLNWDVYGHIANAPIDGSPEGNGGAPCTPDKNGYYTSGSNPPAPFTAPNYFEWCEDHMKPLEAHPFGTVGQGGPVTLPDPNILTNGAWYSGSPYLGPDANLRSVGSSPIPPFGTIANSPSTEAGFAFMWHSHNEREITTNNIFPGGMMMMMLVDPWVFQIIEAN
jgi:FtsP/CotA-like multicopper oxidase with cupredoxin domain